MNRNRIGKHICILLIFVRIINEKLGLQMNLLTFPVGKIFKDMHDGHELFLDIIYILCMKHRPIPKLGVEELLNYGKEVVLLFSDDVAEWASYYKDSRIRIELVKKTEFCQSFKNTNINSFVKWRPDFDIPIKRNYALYDAKNRKAKYIWMLYDDIIISRENYLSALCALKYGKAVVGFHVTEFPDISTVDHVERIIYKMNPCISMTGSCMFFNIEKIQGYFPNVYNEDLFFCMQQLKPDEVVSGGVVKQTKSTPWLDLNRVRHEQFGDFMYNAFKKRFINPGLGLIEWSQEKEIQLSRVANLSVCTSNHILKKVLFVAEEAIRNINVNEVKQFIDSCNFADWVYKYLES